MMVNVIPGFGAAVAAVVETFATVDDGGVITVDGFVLTPDSAQQVMVAIGGSDDVPRG